MTVENKNKVNAQWNSNDANSFLREGDAENCTAVKAVYYYDGICFHVSCAVSSIHREYKVRGTISVMDPANCNKVLEISRSVYDLCMKRAGRHVHAKNAAKKKLTWEINIASAKENDIKQAIINKVDNLMAVFGTVLVDARKNGDGKRTLSPREVAKYYGNDFVTSINVTAKTEKEYLSAIAKFFAALSVGNKPLSDFSAKEISDIMLDSQFARYKSVITRFWDYCNDTKKLGISSSIEKFSLVVEKPKTKAENVANAEHLINDSIRPTAMDDEHELMLLERLKRGDIDYYAAGIALALWGGFTVDQIMEMKWRDIYLDSEDNFFACVRLIQDKISCATHNFTRPIFPDGAKILRMCYDTLSEKYPISIRDLPLVYRKDEPDKPMAKADFNRLADKLLVSTGIVADIEKYCKKTVSHAILRDTYKNNLKKILGEKPLEFGTYKFLLGESLQGQTTSDHYATFTSEDGIRRLYAYLSRHHVETITFDKLREDIYAGGHHTIKFNPRDNHSRQRVEISIALDAGETFHIWVPKGASFWSEKF